MIFGSVHINSLNQVKDDAPFRVWRASDSSSDVSAIATFLGSPA
jgi:hypothetical protein